MGATAYVRISRYCGLAEWPVRLQPRGRVVVLNVMDRRCSSVAAVASSASAPPSSRKE